MEPLLYFGLWAIVIFLMMRYGCGAHVMGHGHGASHGRANSQSEATELRWVPPEKDVDPVCGETVHTVTAKPSVHDGTVYYLCSRECRERFEAAPELYVPEGGQVQAKQEAGHG